MLKLHENELDIDGEIMFSAAENIAENKCVDEHKAEGIQDPPHPVKVGTRNLGLKLRSGGHH